MRECPRCGKSCWDEESSCRNCGQELPATADKPQSEGRLKQSIGAGKYPAEEITLLRIFGLLELVASVALFFFVGLTDRGVNWEVVSICVAGFVSGLLLRAVAGIWAAVERLSRK